MVHRADHSKNFTAINTSTLRDADISMKARGLLCFCLSLPDDWEYSVEGLASICQEGPDAILTMVRELEKAGYIHREQVRKPNGKLGRMQWDIYEIPQSRMAEQKAEEELSGTEEQPAEAQTAEEAPEEPAPEETAGSEPAPAAPVTEKACPDKAIPGERAPESTAQLNIDKLNIDLTKYREKREETPVRSEDRQDGKEVYGRYRNVCLSRTDLAELQAEFPDDWGDRIERISEYMAGHGKRYANPLAMIRKWAREDAPKAAGEAEKAAKGQEKPAEKNSWEMKGVPYGGGGPGEHEIRAVRQLMKRHSREVPVEQVAAAS